MPRSAGVVAQLAAALAQYGDAARATAAYDAAFGPPPKRPIGLRTIDYGSDLRDSAAVLAFAAGARDAAPRRAPPQATADCVRAPAEGAYASAPYTQPPCMPKTN